jgi:NAD(P)-dependent dehydrogenase (short-subunit alcohol dehydrogenase family)
MNKVAIITGAALGYREGGPSIGSSIAFKFAGEGAEIVAVDINEEMVKRTVDEIVSSGGRAVYIKADAGNSGEVQNVIKKAMAEFNGIHCLVNCAADFSGHIFDSVAGTPEEDWIHTFNINLHGYFRFAKYAIPHILKSGGGTIINISSMDAFEVIPDFAVYSVTKAAINGLTRVLAVDHSPKIRTNAICPGFVKIANSENDRSPDELDEWYAGILKSYPSDRLCSPEDIADIACFLASDESAYINGECIHADSGRSISDMHVF